jgi:Rieske Fe-S protein
MTSTIQLDRPTAPAGPRRRRWLIALGAVVATGVAAAAAASVYVLTHDGNQPLPAGTHTVQVYSVDDSISTVVPPADRPGVIGRFIGMCDGDTYYVEVDGTGLCVVLNGSLGTVRATGTGDGVELSAAEAATVRDIVRRDGGGGSGPATRVLLGYDGGWAGMVRVADLNAGGPVHGSAVH